MNSEDKPDDKRWRRRTERRHSPPPSVLHKRQMRRTDETECKAVSGHGVHRRSTSFVLHCDVEERGKKLGGWAEGGGGQEG